jgi:uncharacterized protein
MRIVAIPPQECNDLLSRVSIARLACSVGDQPYVVPVGFAYEPGFLYVFSTLGKKIEWMRQNPKVCVQVDEIGSPSNWLSVVVTGTYVELREPQYTVQREHARELLGKNTAWWETPVVERREQINDISIAPVFFRIDVDSMSGLRAIPEAGV